jgi:hypothetical protein
MFILSFLTRIQFKEQSLHSFCHLVIDVFIVLAKLDWLYFTYLYLHKVNQNYKNNKGWWWYREKRTLIHYGWESKLVQPLWRILKKKKKEHMIYNIVPSIYPQDIKSVCWRNIRTLRFVTAFFTIAKIWDKPRCSSGWTKKLMHTHHGILFSPKKEWNHVICVNMDRTRGHEMK